MGFMCLLKVTVASLLGRNISTKWISWKGIFMSNGYIKLHRKFLKWEWFQDSNTMKLFLYVLLSANHAEARWQGITILRGQLLTGRRKLAENLGLSEMNVRSIIKRLKSTNELTIKSYSKYSIITVVRYDEYQSSNQQTNQQLTSNQPATNQQLTTNKKNKNEKKEEKEEIDIVFFEAYKIYPGSKSKTDNFKTFKKHKDWKECLPLLKPAVEKEVGHKKALKYYGEFCPDFKNFKTWLNQRCWEQEFTAREMPKEEEYDGLF